MNCLGVVEVPLSCLYFLEDVGGRHYYEEHSDHLEELFRGTFIDHNNHRNWVDGYVDSSEMVSVFRNLGLSLSELQQKNLDLKFPRLIGQSVAYSQGRHRIEAAKRVDNDLLWTIRLFSTDMSNIRSNHVIRRQTEQYQHERSYSDGQIYSKLREYSGNKFDFCEWYHRLSNSKKKALRLIDRRLAIAGALDALIQFPGIMESLQLGSWAKYFDWRLDDELYSGLKYIHEGWSTFTFGSHSVQKCFGKETVELLEGRAPGISISDRRWIDSVFEAGEAFRGVRDPEQRREIRERVVSSSSMIPGMKSLQSNMLYLGIAAEIIWSYLIPKKLRKQARVNQMTLRSTMESCWSGTVGYVELKEGEFQPVIGPPSFDLAYLMIILAALRQFAHLSAWKPKADTGELLTDPNCIYLFHRRAGLVGFRTDNIDHGAEVPALPFTPFSGEGGLEAELPDEASLFNKLVYRYGRPHISVFRLLQEMAFLPHLKYACQPEIGVPFLLQEFILCFFGPCTFECDQSQPIININRPPFVSLSYSATAEAPYRSWPNGGCLETIREEDQQTVLSPLMDVDSQHDNTSHTPEHPFSLGLHVAVTRESLPDTPVSRLHLAGDLDSPGRESSSSGSSMSWEASPERVVDSEAAQNVPTNFDEVLSTCSTSSRSLMPGTMSEYVAGVRKTAHCEDSESNRASSSEFSNPYQSRASSQSRSTVSFAHTPVSSTFLMNTSQNLGSHDKHRYPGIYYTPHNSESGQMPFSPHSHLTSRSTIPAAPSKQPRIERYVDAVTAPESVAVRGNSAPLTSDPRILEPNQARYSFRTNSTVQSRSLCPSRVLTKTRSDRSNLVSPARSRDRRRDSCSAGRDSSNSSSQSLPPCMTPSQTAQKQDSCLYYERTKDRPSSTWQGFRDSDDSLATIPLD